MELDNENKTPLRILLVEDDQSLGFVVQDALAMQGYKVHLCRDGKEGLNQFNKEEYDLCLLDVMMPKKDGFSLAEDIRKVNQEIPIVFLTAKGLDQDKILGFRIGADDYITKPFSSEELLLRIKAVLKRSHKLVPSEPSGKQKYQIGIFQFDANNYELIHGNDRKKLTKKESELLKLLTEHQGNVLERVIIGNLIWGDDSYFVGRSMDVFITKLRKYLSADPHIAITNVHGVGFRLEVKG
jgi:DNA-binding response OmpR family regulator